MRKRKNRGQFKKGRTKTVVRYRTRAAAKPKKRRRTAKRSRTGRSVAGAVGSVAAGAAMGALANEAGLLYAAPTQNKTGISVVGWTGLGLITLGVLFARREVTKILTYGLGGGLLTTEVVRQIDLRGYDFTVAFGTNPPILVDPTPGTPQLAASNVDEEKARNGLKVRSNTNT